MASPLSIELRNVAIDDDGCSVAGGKDLANGTGHRSRRADHRSTRHRALRRAVAVPGRRFVPSSPEIAGKSSGFVVVRLTWFLKHTSLSV